MGTLNYMGLMSINRLCKKRQTAKNSHTVERAWELGIYLVFRKVREGFIIPSPAGIPDVMVAPDQRTAEWMLSAISEVQLRA